MYKKLFIIKILTICFILCSSSIAGTSDNFDRGVKLYDKKDFDNSRILFERDIVFNPKNENSYLYLAKIFNQSGNELEEEVNLNNVILINPKNDEAIYMLTLIKIKQSNYDEAKKLINNFDLVCKSFCSKKDEMQKKFEKLIPTNEQNKN